MVYHLEENLRDSRVAKRNDSFPGVNETNRNHELIETTKTSQKKNKNQSNSFVLHCCLLTFGLLLSITIESDVNASITSKSLFFTVTMLCKPF